MVTPKRMTKAFWIAIGMAVAISLAVPVPAQAGSKGRGHQGDQDWEHERDHHGKGGKHRYKGKHHRGKSAGYRDGHKHAYKEFRHGGPPPWAPAHGYRAKHRRGHDHRVAAAPIYLPDAGIGQCNRETVGMILGGAGGALIGTQIGSGSGKTAAIIGGTILGAIVGGSVGRSMDNVDQGCVGHALERADTGQAVRWENPDRHGQYQVTPIRTYQTQEGTYCREYQTVIVIGGREERAHGTACRQSDGSWKKST